MLVVIAGDRGDHGQCFDAGHRIQSACRGESLQGLGKPWSHVMPCALTAEGQGAWGLLGGAWGRWGEGEREDPDCQLRAGSRSSDWRWISKGNIKYQFLIYQFLIIVTNVIHSSSYMVGDG